MKQPKHVIIYTKKMLIDKQLESIVLMDYAYSDEELDAMSVKLINNSDVIKAHSEIFDGKEKNLIK